MNFNGLETKKVSLVLILTKLTCDVIQNEVFVHIMPGIEQLSMFDFANMYILYTHTYYTISKMNVICGTHLMTCDGGMRKIHPLHSYSLTHNRIKCTMWPLSVQYFCPLVLYYIDIYIYTKRACSVQRYDQTCE